MDSKDIRNLSEAYLEVYQVDEAEKWIQKAIKKPGALSKQLGVPEKENIPAEKLAAAAKKGGKLGKRARLAMTLKGLRREEIDLYDIIFSHLLDEGYANTPEAANVIMANMSEGWRESILEAEVIAMKGGVPGSVKVKPALSIPGTSIGIGPNKPVPGTFTRTTPEQRAKIASGDKTIDRGTYQQSRVGAGPTSAERSRYNAELVRQGKHSAARMPQ